MSKENKERKNGKKFFLFPILFVFVILGGFVFHISATISEEMSQSAIGNLSESLELIKGTLEELLDREAQFQKMIAQELAMSDDQIGRAHV